IVTLEPCCHVGRTPPCTEAIIAAGIARVWVGCEDPNPLVAGKGLAALRDAGIEVHSGIHEAACHNLNHIFNHWITTQRPRIVLKLATSLDGKIATATRASQWITGPDARREVHALRNQFDAVMVGSGTALADDPALTVRDVPLEGNPPARVLVDSRLRVDLDAKLFAQDGASVVVAAGEGVDGDLVDSRRDLGAAVLTLPTSDEHLDLHALMARLGALAPFPIQSILVEGGSGLATALLREDLVDEVRLFMAPIWIGSDGLAVPGPLGVTHPDEAPRFIVDRVSRHGSDLQLHLRRKEAPSCSLD
ncbi:MAG: bifunctional diaminohydroxyphosphoribosylaminopyrimidine deaminase/5-amino-6-(5-phosphoribosylamino)uracil reductase RibD, partial [Myxococcota bacterium]|nr:bifunctional diaminohydroxyphosphoribosylaminopyrimidine deaminase/5-amino-6-(5-phosphoribosylamino)uracil reductase RibD [Myxococcota bacterium]